MRIVLNCNVLQSVLFLLFCIRLTIKEGTSYGIIKTMKKLWPDHWVLRRDAFSEQDIKAFMTKDVEKYPDSISIKSTNIL